jgi:Fe-S-cluster containining protein
MSALSQSKWYAEGLRFDCQRCGACCTGEPGYVWVADAEAIRIAKFLGLSPEEFSGKYLRRAGTYDSLIELPDGRCIFYAGVGCAIYPVRPGQCRTFPFWQSVIVSPEAWRRCQQKCPGMGKGKLYSVEEISEMARSCPTDGGGPGLRPR